jgi:hypothetical protein
MLEPKVIQQLSVKVGGDGTVTDFSFTDFKGIQGSVINPTTTPNLTIILNAIEPTAINCTGSGDFLGNLTAANLSGTNTGDQNLSGYQLTSAKNSLGGYAGLSTYRLISKNNTGAIESYITNLNTASRIYTFPDRTITIAGTDEIIPPNSWQNIGACSFVSTDTPTFVMNVSGDYTNILSEGYRIKLTQTTDKFFIITKVGTFTGGNTAITLYGGTDYTLLNAAITTPQYSPYRFPLNFPSIPEKWTVSITTTTPSSTLTPTANTWYNHTSIVIPIGSWIPKLTFKLGGGKASNTFNTQASFSTTNNTSIYANNISCNSFSSSRNYICSILDSINLATKATYYLNYQTTTAAVDEIGIYADATLQATNIKLLSAYY